MVTTSGNEKSLYFEGIDSFTVFTDYALQSVEDFAISMWVKLDVDDSWEGLLSKGYLDGNNNGFTIRREEDNNKIRVSRSSGNEFENILESTTSITASSGWTNVIVQREGNDWELFINGVSEDTETINDGVSQTFNNTDDFVFAKGNGTGEYLEGYLDDFVLFDDSLTSSEISELYNNGGWRSPSEISASSDILFLYTLDEDATDSSGNNRSSTNNGADFVDIVPSSTTNTDQTYWNFNSTSSVNGDLVTISEGMDIADSGKITVSVDYALNDELPESTDVFLWRQAQGGELNVRMGRGPSTNTQATTGNTKYFIQMSIKDGGWKYLTHIIDYDTDRHNITAVFDRDGDLRLYFDHVEVESLSYTSGSLANGTFYNDAISWTYSHNWGTADFDIYRTTAWESTAFAGADWLYKSGIENITTPTSRYDWDEAAGSSTITDSVGGLNGTVVSGTGGGSDSIIATLTTNEDTDGNIDLSDYVSDVDGDNLTYSIDSDVSNGSTSVSVVL